MRQVVVMRWVLVAASACALVWGACSYTSDLEGARLAGGEDLGPEEEEAGGVDLGGGLPPQPCAAPADCVTPLNPCLAAACEGGFCQDRFREGACDDGDLCTAQDQCQQGACVGVAIQCQGAAPVCDPATGQCVACLQSQDCAGGFCAGQRCLQCRVDEDCQQGSSCVGGRCVECAVDSDCDDDNDCTEDSCGADQRCLFQAIVKSCDDGDTCTLNDACVGGRCVGEVMSCAQGQCIQGSCYQCVEMEDCPEGYQCHEGRCVQCVTDEECPRGEGACEAGRCQEGQCVVEALDAGECPLEDGSQGFCARGRCVECTSGAQCPAQTCEAALCNERGRCITAPEPNGAPCGPERARVSCGLWGVERPCGLCQDGACEPSFGEDCAPSCAQADALCGWVGVRDCEEGCAYGLLRNDSAQSAKGECCFQAVLGPTCGD